MDDLKETLMKKRKPVHDKCLGRGFSETEKKFIKLPTCPRIESYDQNKDVADGDGTISFCSTYIDPTNKWAHDKRCPMSEHFRPDLVDKEEKRQRVGQQKQKKKA